MISFYLINRYIDCIQTELVLAIYEVGQCFFQGWGVAKDQKMAVVSNRFLEIHVGYLLKYRATIPLLHD